MSKQKLALVIEVYGPDLDCFDGISRPWLESSTDCHADFLFRDEFDSRDAALSALTGSQIFVPESCVAIVSLDETLFDIDEVAKLLPVTVLGDMYAEHQFSACGYFDEYPRVNRHVHDSFRPSNFAILSPDKNFNLVVASESHTGEIDIQVVPGIN